jgi:hypothetical protein
MKPTCARKAGSPDPRRDKAVDNGGLHYGAAESAFRPPLPTATRALAEIQIQASLDQRLRAKHHPIDPRKQTPGGRHQIGIPAGFKSESVAGFLLECVAGFVGNCSLEVLRRSVMAKRHSLSVTTHGPI